MKKPCVCLVPLARKKMLMDDDYYVHNAGSVPAEYISAVYDVLGHIQTMSDLEREVDAAVSLILEADEKFGASRMMTEWQHSPLSLKVLRLVVTGLEHVPLATLLLERHAGQDGSYEAKCIYLSFLGCLTHPSHVDMYGGLDMLRAFVGVPYWSTFNFDECFETYETFCGTVNTPEIVTKCATLADIILSHCGHGCLEFARVRFDRLLRSSKHCENFDSPWENLWRVLASHCWQGSVRQAWVRAVYRSCLLMSPKAGNAAPLVGTDGKHHQPGNHQEAPNNVKY